MAFSAPASNPFGGFGQTSAAPASSSPFGAPAASTPAFGSSVAAPSGGGLFGSSNAGGGGNLFGASKPAAGGNAFGSAAPTNGAPAASGSGLFGASTSQPAAPVSGGLFGGGATSTAPASGGLFGSTAAPSGGLFGSANGPAAATGQGAGASLFGGGATAGGGGLFGNKPAAVGGGFGASTAGGAGAGGGFGGFGSSANAGGAGGAFGGSLLGQPGAGAPQAGAPGPGGLVLTKTTRFNDLPQEYKNQVEELDRYIQEEALIGEELRAREFGLLIKDGRGQVRDLSGDVASLSSQVSHTSSTIRALRRTLDGLTTALLRAGTLIDASKAPQDRELAARASKFARFPFEWFEERTADMERKLVRVQEGMENVAGLLRGYGDRGNPAAIVPALRAQHATFMSLASTVAVLDGQLNALKDDFRALWRRQMGGSARDPFEEALIIESGVGVGMASMRL